MTKEADRKLARARELYIELKTKPQAQTLLRFTLNTSKWSETRVKAREQHVRALKNAEEAAGAVFDAHMDQAARAK